MEIFVADKCLDATPKVELDMPKAFTKSSVDIVRHSISIFSMCSNPTRKMDFNKMRDDTLYYVQNLGKKHTAMLNRKFVRVLIWSISKTVGHARNPNHKLQPLFKLLVNYQDIVKQLWDKKISENNKEDMAIKKQVAVVNFGLLERTKRTDSKRVLFRNLTEASDFQQKHGGGGGGGDTQTDEE